MWFGTYNGLNRFDGYRFLSYKPESRQPLQSLAESSSTRCFRTAQARCGSLSMRNWTGSIRLLRRFFHYRANPNDPASLAGHVEHIAQDRDGMLWLATRNGLDRLDPASGRFTHYRNDPTIPAV